MSLLQAIWYCTPESSVIVWPLEPGHNATAVEVELTELDPVVPELAVDWPPICEDVEEVVVAELLLAIIPPTYPVLPAVNVNCPALK